MYTTQLIMNSSDMNCQTTKTHSNHSVTHNNDTFLEKETRCSTYPHVIYEHTSIPVSSYFVEICKPELKHLLDNV